MGVSVHPAKQGTCSPRRTETRRVRWHYSALMGGGGVCKHEGSHVLPPPLHDGAMSSACVPARFCLCSVARSTLADPGGQAAPCAGATWGTEGSVPRLCDWFSVPRRQAQAGSAAVWSLGRGGRSGSAKAKGSPPSCPAHLPSSCPVRPAPSRLTSPGSDAAGAAGLPVPASVAARGL